jgi:hypothetical protein
MSDEVAPLSGTEAVSLDTAAIAAKEAALITSGVKKKPADRTPEELKAVRKYQNLTQSKSRAKQNARKDIVNARYSSQEEVSKKEARLILQESRLIRNPRAIEVCIELAETACRNLKITMNQHIFSHGIQATLQALATKKDVEPPPIDDVWNPGERVREHELKAVWDYSTSWRTQPDGSQISYEDFKAMRRRCITDIVWFGNHVLGKDFQAEPHGVWAKDLFPQLEPALLSLPEKFGQKDIAKAFQTMSDVRQRCLIAARSSFKSTFSTVFTLALMLCFAGSVRILVSTATQPLAKGFARSFRSMLTVRDPNNSSLLNQLWPEHCITPDEGKSLEYTSPFRQLDALIEPTLMATSVISEGQAGMRYDLAVMDDCAEISNSSTPEMRSKTQERIDMLRELGEPHSLTNYVGTPISPGLGTEDDPGDLYSVLLRREEKNKAEGGDPKLLYAICPAWTLKAGVSKKAWDPTLTEDAVDLLFPARLTFRYLMGKLKECLATDSTAKIFRQQSLVSWVPDDESEVTVTFSEAVLRSRLHHRGFFDATALGAPVYMAIDVAWSIARTADFSAISVVRVQPIIETKQNAMVVLDVVYGRWKESEKITNICRVIETHKISSWVLERDRGHEELVLGVRKLCLQKGLPMPYVLLRDIKNEPRAKGLKVKILEAPLVDSRLMFSSGSWNDACFQQFIRFDGLKKSGSGDNSKDDIPDSIATAYQTWGPRAVTDVIDPEEAERKRQEDEEEGARERKRASYQAMFGGTPYTPPPPQPTAEEQPEQSRDPRLRLFGSRGKWRM